MSSTDNISMQQLSVCSSKYESCPCEQRSNRAVGVMRIGRHLGSICNRRVGSRQERPVLPYIIQLVYATQDVSEAQRYYRLCLRVCLGRSMTTLVGRVKSGKRKLSRCFCEPSDMLSYVDAS